MDKPVIIVQVKPDGEIEIQSNITDLNVVRIALKKAEEAIVFDALKKASPQQSKIIPVHAIPNLAKTN
jgi:hypothetical protein